MFAAATQENTGCIFLHPLKTLLPQFTKLHEMAETAADTTETTNDEPCCCVCHNEGPVHACVDATGKSASAGSCSALKENTLLSLCADPEHTDMRMCVDCNLQNLLINRVMPKCAHPECRRVMAFALAQEVFGHRHKECAAIIEFLRASYEAVHHPECPKCSLRGDASGDGVISFGRVRTRKRKTSCWTTEGAHVSAEKTFSHPDLCEKCCGPWQRCLCNATSKPFHANHYFRDATAISTTASESGGGGGGGGARKRFVQRNHQLTASDVESFLQWLISFANKEVPAVCPACSKLLWRTEDCNELSCCGGAFRICFHCGHAARGPSLVDHYIGNGGVCVRWPTAFRHPETGEKCPCTAECQSQTHDCALPEHAEWRAMYADVRLSTWGRRFVRALSKTLAKHTMRWLVAKFFPDAPPLRLPVRLEPLQDVPAATLTDFQNDQEALRKAKCITKEWIQIIDDRLT